MSDSITHIADRLGDSISVESRKPYADELIVAVNESGQESCVFLDHEQAESLANSILTAVGKTTVSADSIPLAGNLSFNECVLRTAAIHKRTVAFRYQKQNSGFIESRRVNPEQIVGEGDALAVVGRDPDRDAPRRYRLERIQGEVTFA